MFSKIFQRFMNKSPVPVMVRVLWKRVLYPENLNSIFERIAVEQYTRTLLFSTVFDLMNLVIFKTFSSVNAAYKEESGKTGVSITSLYNKLDGNCIEASEYRLDVLRETRGGGVRFPENRSLFTIQCWRWL